MACGGGPSGAGPGWASASSGMLQADSSTKERAILRYFMGFPFVAISLDCRRPACKATLGPRKSA
ncbi:hypothetical protein D3C72_2356360 [compost metagenome]